MGKTRDVFKKIRYSKGTFHAKTGKKKKKKKKDGNGMVFPFFNLSLNLASI